VTIIHSAAEIFMPFIQFSVNKFSIVFNEK